MRSVRELVAQMVAAQAAGNAKDQEPEKKKKAAEKEWNPFRELKQKLGNTRLGRIWQQFDQRTGGRAGKAVDQVAQHAGKFAKRGARKAGSLTRKARGRAGKWVGDQLRKRVGGRVGRGLADLLEPTPKVAEAAPKVPNGSTPAAAETTTAAAAGESVAPAAAGATAETAGAATAAAGAGAGTEVAGVTGATGAVGAGAGAEAGAAAEVLGAGAAGGPVGIAIAAVVASGVALYEVAKAGVELAYQEEQHARQLAQHSPGQTAAIAQLDARRVQRTIQSGEATAPGTEQLTQAIDHYEESMRPFEDAATSIKQFLSGAVTEAVANVLEILKPIADGINLMARLANMQKSAQEKNPLGSYEMNEGFRRQQERMDRERREAAEAARRARG
ncbi:hypothetical protein FRUB_02108 [Fimbriiglobus ruber]|uniref:Uncharacterized protein n=1 Tax=Fimbriiglobus ruber TaxID=1908690 RepID=A0A225EBM9_9BACT|nr:hypothetical protein FRUB_02108 [Fimbriiglobus ruber]